MSLGIGHWVCLKESLFWFCSAEDGVLLDKSPNSQDASSVRIFFKYSFFRGNLFLSQRAQSGKCLNVFTFGPPFLPCQEPLSNSVDCPWWLHLQDKVSRCNHKTTWKEITDPGGCTDPRLYDLWGFYFIANPKAINYCLASNGQMLSAKPFKIPLLLFFG